MDAESLVAEFLLDLGYIDTSRVTDEEELRSFVGKKRFCMRNSMFTSDGFHIVTEWGLKFDLCCDWRSGPYFFLTDENTEKEEYHSIGFNLHDPDSLEKLKIILESERPSWWPPAARRHPNY